MKFVHENRSRRGALDQTRTRTDVIIPIYFVMGTTVDDRACEATIVVRAKRYNIFDCFILCLFKVNKKCFRPEQPELNIIKVIFTFLHLYRKQCRDIRTMGICNLRVISTIKERRIDKRTPSYLTS